MILFRKRFYKILNIFIIIFLSFFITQIRFVRNPIIINNGKVFNGKNKIYIWIGDGDCSQKENMPPMFKMRDNSSLISVNMINAPDGIHIYGSNVGIKRIRNFDVCEDAISTKKDVKNIIIKDSIFLRCFDKAIQLNYGDNFKIMNNLFLYCKQPIRIPKNARRVIIKNNFFHGLKKEYYLREK